jgi:hypothetical protein
MVSGDETVTAGGRPELLRRGATADVGHGGSMEGMEAAEVREGWTCEGVEGHQQTM